MKERREGRKKGRIKKKGKIGLRGIKEIIVSDICKSR